MSDLARFFWISTRIGDWNDSANWADLTTGQTPALVAPGSLDVVSINNGTLTGSGASASLTIEGFGTVLGQLNTDTLSVQGTGSASAILDINAGATINAASAVDVGGILVSGEAAVLLVDGTLQVGTPSSSGALSVTGGGDIQTSNLNLGSDSSQLTVDGSSTIEIGNMGTAATGALTIDPGQAASGSGLVIGNIVDNGLIESDDLTLGQPFVYSGGQGSSSYEGADFTSLMSGTGTLEMTTGGTAVLQEPVESPGLTFQLDGTANLNIEASISSGNTISLGGNSNTLTINDQWYLQEHPAPSTDQNPYFTGAPPRVDATINGFDQSDALNFVDDPFLGTTITNASYSNGTLDLFDGSTIISTFNLIGSNYYGDTFSVSDPNDSQQSITVACFAAGTGILTSKGETAVEHLREGDPVIVLRPNGRFEEKVKWVGYRRIELDRHPQRHLVAPILIRRHALAPEQPHRDLLVSPDHCLFVEGRLIPAVMLVNHMTIVQKRDQKDVLYHHVELDQHGILLANGLATESYLDTGNRAMFANAGLAMLLHPKFQINRSLKTWACDACAPLTVDETTLEPIWRQLANRAEQLQFQPRHITTDTNPNLRVIVEGEAIIPTSHRADRYMFILPAGTSRVTLSSRATRPADIVPYLDDRRLLGVAVAVVTLSVGKKEYHFPADHLPGERGWHAYEKTSTALWRWTDGAGELDFSPLPQAAVMVIRLSGSTPYIVEARDSQVAA